MTKTARTSPRRAASEEQTGEVTPCAERVGCLRRRVRARASPLLRAAGAEQRLARARSRPCTGSGNGRFSVGTQCDAGPHPGDHDRRSLADKPTLSPCTDVNEPVPAIGPRSGPMASPSPNTCFTARRRTFFPSLCPPQGRVHQLLKQRGIASSCADEELPLSGAAHPPVPPTNPPARDRAARPARHGSAGATGRGPADAPAA